MAVPDPLHYRPLPAWYFNLSPPNFEYNSHSTVPQLITRSIDMSHHTPKFSTPQQIAQQKFIHKIYNNIPWLSPYTKEG